jgi:hypothetical protein
MDPKERESRKVKWGGGKPGQECEELVGREPQGPRPITNPLRNCAKASEDRGRVCHGV